MELLDLGVIDVVAAGVVMFVASVVRGYSGFGFSAVLVAGLAFIIDPVEAVSLAIAMEVLASIVQGPSVWTDINWPRLWVLLVAAVVGNPVGVLILTTVDAEPLRLVTFVVLGVLTAALLLGGTTTRVSATPMVVFAVGVLAGVVNGATAMSGLVLVLAMTALSVAPAELRGTLVAYFFASDIIVLGLLYWRGEFDQIYFWRVAMSMPVMVIGVLIGSKAFRGTSVEAFRRNTLILLLVIAAIGLARVALGAIS